MKRTLQVLILAKDSALRSEFEGAVSDLLDDFRIVIHAETDGRRGVEHAVNRSPDIVLLELGDDLSGARDTVKEIRRSPSGPLVVMVYRPQMIGDGDRPESVLIHLMRAGAGDFLRRPISTGEVEDLLRRHFTDSDRAPSKRGRIISFFGNKGGVGKSTVSLSVACGLARKAPGRVLLIDASLQHGAMCDLLGLQPEASITDAARQIDRLDERLLRMFSASHECGLRVLAAPPSAIEAAPVDDQALARILSVARRAFDYVIVDTFPLVDSVTVAILDVADLVFVVLNDFVPAVLGTAELLSVLDTLGVAKERVRVVLNRTHTGFRGRLEAVDVADRLEHDLDFLVPFSRQAMSATNSGEPFALRAPRWRGFGKAIQAIEKEIARSSLGSPVALDVIEGASESGVDDVEVSAPEERRPSERDHTHPVDSLEPS